MPKLSASDKEFRRACAVAVLQGIWTCHGDTLMNIAEQDEFAIALRGASRTAFQQADEMLRREQQNETSQ